MLQKIPRIGHQKANQTVESALFDMQSAQKHFDLLQKKNLLGNVKMDLILAVHLAVNGSSNIMMDERLKVQFKAMNLNDISYEEYCRSYFKAKSIIDEEEKKKKSTDALLKNKKKKSGIHVSSRQMLTYLANRDLERDWVKKGRAREIKKSEKKTLKDLCW